MRDQIWLKLIGNVAFNPVTALTGATLGQLGTLPEMVDLLRAIFDECAQVADRLGREVPGLARPAAGGRAGRRRPQDLDAPGPGSGQAARARLHDRRGSRAGRPLDIAVPHIRTIHACVSLLDKLNQPQAV